MLKPRGKCSVHVLSISAITIPISEIQHELQSNSVRGTFVQQLKRKQAVKAGQDPVDTTACELSSSSYCIRCSQFEIYLSPWNEYPPLAFNMLSGMLQLQF